MKIQLTILAMAIVPVYASDPFVAHEWGTFTSVAGGVYGAPLQWAPLSGSPDLPCFVERLKFPATKYSPATVRMETPVMFFYAKQALTLTVAAQFPLGWMTDWYPKATKVDPIAPNASYLKNGGLSGATSEFCRGRTQRSRRPMATAAITRRAIPMRRRSKSVGKRRR